MATQQSIKEKLVTFKRITHCIAVKICQTCSDIAKSNAKYSNIKKLKCQKIIKESKDSEPRIIEKI